MTSKDGIYILMLTVCLCFHSVKLNKLLATKSNRKGVPIHDGQSGLPKYNLVWSCLHLSLRLLLRLRGEDALLDLELLLVEGESAAVAEAQRRAVRHPRRAVRRRHALTCMFELLRIREPSTNNIHYSSCIPFATPEMEAK